MNVNKSLMILVLPIVLGGLPGCALLTKSSPIVPRYFEPETDLRSEQTSNVPAASGEKRLRLGRIEASPHLRERMVYRTSELEVGYYENRRWTERPEAYVRRALSRSLFERHGIVPVVSGAASNLDAELVAFEEIQGDEHRVRVGIVLSLDDPSGGALQRTITVEEPVAKGSEEGKGSEENDTVLVVRAFSTALARAVERVSEIVLAGLEQVPAVPPAPTLTTTPAAETTD